MNDTKVSVIMPVFNAEYYLRAALDDVIHQTLKDIEIICVDDGSTDSSLDILEEYRKKDHRIKVLYQRVESDGAGLARNLGMQHAKGEYLSFLDADDLFETDMLLKAYEKAKECNADIVCFDAFVYNTDNGMDYYTKEVINLRNLPSKDVFHPKDEAGKLFQMYCGSPWNNLFRREFVERNEIKFASVHIADDIGFVDLAFALADKVAIIRERLMHYRRNARDNQTSKYTKWPWVGYQPFCLLKEEMEKRGVFAEYKITFVNAFLGHAGFYLAQMKTKESFERLYNDLRMKYLDELSAFEIEDDDLDPSLLVLRNRIKEFSPDEYLFDCTRANSFFDSKSLIIPYARKDKEYIKIVLYGAGVFGKDIYCKLLDEKTVDVVRWVDKNHESIFGGGICSPEIIPEVEYDYVFVAITAPRVYRAVKSYLMDIGVAEAKIIWMEEGRTDE